MGKVIEFAGRNGRITEVEAYLGQKDPASLSYGTLAERKKVFFGPAGIAYVFLAYGMHWCFSVITEPTGKAGGVLISGVGDTFGPGRVSKYFGICGDHNGVDLTVGPITIVDDGYQVRQVDVGPRIGITKGLDLPLRFVAGQGYSY